MSAKRLIVGISGASGAIYGIRMLQLLRQVGIETHLVISRSAQVTLAYETNLKVAEVTALAHTSYAQADIGAAISSGSFRTMGMVVAPCSMRTLGEIATCVSSSLLTRAADVVLKERRRLVLMVRETPLHLGHLRAMEAATEMGAIVYPPSPPSTPSRNRLRRWWTSRSVARSTCSTSTQARSAAGAKTVTTPDTENGPHRPVF